MTKDQMHNTLRYMREQLADERGSDFSGVEALDMVIAELEQEPSGDLISRQAVLEIQTKYAEHIGATKFWQMRDDIKALPPVTQKSKIGYWFAWRPEDDVWRTTCSECGEETRTLWDYCPHCGAKMVEPQESEVQE